MYVPTEGVEITGPLGIRYEKHPWIERFETDGIVPAKPRRTGFGTKDAKGFVKSLNTIYAPAYDEWFEYGEDAAGYFAHVTDSFVRRSHDVDQAKIFHMFCGFTENVWREGTREMHDVVMDVMLPVINKDEIAQKVFKEAITDEFREYIEGGRNGTEE